MLYFLKRIGAVGGSSQVQAGCCISSAGKLEPAVSDLHYVVENDRQHPCTSSLYIVSTLLILCSCSLFFVFTAAYRRGSSVFRLPSSAVSLRRRWTICGHCGACSPRMPPTMHTRYVSICLSVCLSLSACCMLCVCLSVVYLSSHACMSVA